MMVISIIKLKGKLMTPETVPQPTPDEVLDEESLPEGDELEEDEDEEDYD